jgi:hypothetical protein
MTEDLQRPFSIQIISEETRSAAVIGEKGLFAPEERIARQVASLDLSQFSVNLQAFCQEIGSAFDKISAVVDKFELDSFELTLDVTAKGEVRFIGSAGTEIKGGLKVVFQRK